MQNVVKIGSKNPLKGASELLLAQAVQLEHQAVELRHLAARVAERPVFDDINETSASQIALRNADLPQLSAFAGKLLKSRLYRKRHLPDELFGEPAWNMLLDAFIARVEERRVSVTSLCIASHQPPTTALRWVRVLEKRGFIQRKKSEDDGRLVWVSLTDECFENLKVCLRDLRDPLYSLA